MYYNVKISFNVTLKDIFTLKFIILIQRGVGERLIVPQIISQSEVLPYESKMLPN
jgi:hypothetical protein